MATRLGVSWDFSRQPEVIVSVSKEAKDINEDTADRIIGARDSELQVMWISDGATLLVVTISKR
jgi:hypothetical protein